MKKYDYYIEQYKQAHKDPTMFPGISIRYYVKDIAQFIDETRTKTLLDFGCGKGEQYTNVKLMQKWGKLPNEIWGITPSLYDPAVTKHDIFPEETFDGVISTDVMEHVPEDAIDFVLEQIFSKADKFVYMAIATYLGKTTADVLPNGEQPHITVHPDDWWIERISEFIPNDIKVWVCFNGRSSEGKQLLTNWKNFT